MNIDGLALSRILGSGDATNNTSFEADGTIVNNGTASTFEDLNWNPTELVGSGTAPSLINFGSSTIGIAGFSATSTDEITSSAELPHSWKVGSEIQFHFHWYPTTTNVGNALFRLEYLFTKEGVAVTTSTTVDLLVASSGVAWAKKSSAFTNIVTTGVAEFGSQFHFRFARVGGDASDTYTGVTAVSTVGFHYESDTLGSRLISSK
jgi:hypothetical protein